MSRKSTRHVDGATNKLPKCVCCRVFSITLQHRSAVPGSSLLIDAPNALCTSLDWEGIGQRIWSPTCVFFLCTNIPRRLLTGATRGVTIDILHSHDALLEIFDYHVESILKSRPSRGMAICWRAYVENGEPVVFGPPGDSSQIQAMW